MDNKKNISGALAYFEKAGDQGSSAAMNGLGYIYYHGVTPGVSDDGQLSIEANKSKAFHYFLTAAENQSDSADSYFNSGHMLQYGIGILYTFICIYSCIYSYMYSYMYSYIYSYIY